MLILKQYIILNSLLYFITILLNKIFMYVLINYTNNLNFAPISILTIFKINFTVVTQVSCC